VAITLDVITKVVDGSLRDSSSTVERHFARAGEQAGTGFSKSFSKSITNSAELQKSFDKAADAAGKLRVEQQKLEELQSKGVGGAKLIAQQERIAKVTRETQRAVRETTDTFQKADRAAGSMLSTLSNITAGTRIGGLTAQASSLASSLSGVGLATGVAIGGFTAIAVGAVAAANKLYDMGKTWDDVSDNITRKTGLVGDALASVTDQVANVSRDTAASIEDIGKVAGDTVQSLKLSGDQLGVMTQRIVELNGLTGEETNLRQLGQVFRKFHIDAGDQTNFLESLYQQYKATGVPINQLIDTIVKGGSVLSGFGLTLDQVGGLLGVFEQDGIPAEAAIRGLNIAFGKLVAAGKEPLQGLKDIVAQIKALSDAGDKVGAADLAEKYFGKKGFAPILQAIVDSNLELDKMPDKVKGVGTSIHDATTATEDFAEHWQKFKNSFAADLKPASDAFFSWMNDNLDSLLHHVDQLTGALANIFGDGNKSVPGGRNANILGGSPKVGSAGNVPINGINLATIPVAAQQYANDCIDAAAQIILSHSGVNMTQDQLMKIIPAGGSIDSLAAGMNQLNPQGNFKAMQGSGGNPQAMFEALKASIDNGTGSILNIAPGRSLGGRAFADGHYVAITGYNPDGTINVSDTATGRQYSVTQAEAFQASQGRGIVAGTGTGPQSSGGDADYGVGSAAGVPIPRRNKTAPVGPTAAPSNVGPGVAPSSPSIADFPSADQVGPASGVTTPVQMIPSPFGPQYSSVPAGSTPGYNSQGKPGTYLPDAGRIKSATEQYQSSLDGIRDANERLQEAIDAQAEQATIITTTTDEKNRAQKAVDDATKRRDKAIAGAHDAEDALAEAKLGTFQEAQKAQQAKASAASSALGDVGSGLSDDFGISGGLPGMAKWFTTYLANMAFAPMIGQLLAVSAVNPIKGGSGLLGMMGAQNLAATGNVLGNIGPGPLGGGVVGPGTGTSDSIPAMLSNGEYVLPADTVNGMGGPGGVSSMVQGYAEGGPVNSMQSVPQSTQGGSGFQGLGGMPMQAITTAVAAAGPALDAIAPGASQAAQIGVQLANRTAAFAGQLAGIGVGGLLETFLPHGSPLADPGKSWLGKIASGFAGARPAMPNTAGGQSPAGQPAPAQTPEQAAALNQQTTQPNAPMVNIEQMNNNTPDGGRTIADQVAWHGMVANGAGGPR